MVNTVQDVRIHVSVNKMNDHRKLFGFSRKDFRIAVYAGCSGLVLVIFCVLVGYGVISKGNQHAANACVSTLAVNNVSSYNMQTPLQRSCPEAEEIKTNHGEIEAITFYTEEPAMMIEDNENEGNECYWNKNNVPGRCDNYLIPYETAETNGDEFICFSNEYEQQTIVRDEPFDPVYLNLYQPLNHQPVQHHYTEL
ncbi:Hypothetical predicted protein [Mytilus galloprovincialis]|uniref:Uncharacterized protein n=1 Tax=Mytilus galloprovincialis TaxID=29158 RepID=A0A8B6EHA9_MYTGA|nr:Hypothetical predicted protein [Mytilus galloprovincialis]